jgi:rod shape-determining protein MreB
MKRVIGIDFGTTKTSVYVSKKGVIYNEPTVIAINKDTKKVINAGYLAFKLLGKAPDNIKVIQPLKNGVVSHIPAATLYLETVLKDLKLKPFLRSAQVIVSLPSELTQVEENALRLVMKNLKVKNLVLKTQGYLAAIGGNKDGAAIKGTIAVNIGGGITDISVLSNGEVLLCHTSNFSGNTIDQRLIRFLRKNHHLIVSKKTAEYIKMKIGSVEPYPENRLLEISGIDVVSSLPHSVVISTQEIKSCIVETIQPLIDDVIDCLEMTPPEVASDIIQSGVLISGGSSLLTGMRDYLETALNISVRLASNPSDSVMEGIRILAHQNLIEQE